MEAPEQPTPPAKRTRRRRTDDQRLAELQTQLARLNQASEKARRRAAAAVPLRRTPHAGAGNDPVDAELRELVEGFVAALRDVVRTELIAQAKRSLMSR